MLGIVVFFFFLIAGCVAAYRVFSAYTRMTRLWFGLVLGLVEMMWFPSLFAFACDFTHTAQLYAMELSALIAIACVLFVPRRQSVSYPNADPPVKFVLWLIVPLFLLSGYLQYTHTLLKIDGALYVGQSTYGDLCMHLGFSTSLVGSSYPPEYSILPGAILGYPFLVDALSATMLVFGCDLAVSFIIPGTVMMTVVGFGFIMFAWRVSGKKSATAVAFLLLFLNGGLGFVYTLDRVFSDSGRLQNALNGFYLTPTNMPDLNLRWVNVICDMLIPQRTTMAGWVCVMPALYLLITAMRTEKRSLFVALGVLGGAMPMIHTHSFLALGLISMGAMGYSLLKAKNRIAFWKRLINFSIYGFIAVLLALPQLLEWTFPQTFKGGSIRFVFNWVNFDEQTGWLRDEYFWFWIKNVGVVFLFFVPAAMAARRERKALAWGALIVFVVAETVQFQPNVYDNNKLFYVAFIVMLPITADYLCALSRRLKGIPGRRLYAAAFLIVSTLSGAISVARECASSYQIFAPGQVLAAEYIKENTDSDATFLTGTQHNNAVSTLTGRNIVCGSSIYVFFHGLDYAKRQADATLMLAYPEKYVNLYREYGVEYVFVSSFEQSALTADTAYIDNPDYWQSEYRADTEYFETHFLKVFVGGPWYDTVTVYEVPETWLFEGQSAS